MERGADANAQPTRVKGMTALQAAAASCCLNMVKPLLERGANVNAATAIEGGRAALQAAAAARNEPGLLATAKLLLGGGAEVNAPGAAIRGLTAVAEVWPLDVMRLLLENVNAVPTPHGGRTALQTAARHKHLNAAKLLGSFPSLLLVTTHRRPTFI